MSANSTGSFEPEIPLLSHEEAERIYTKIAPAISQHRLVLIGGQAVAFWRSQLSPYLPPDAPVIASRDVDFQGSQGAGAAVRQLLNGSWRGPGHDSTGVLNGVVSFEDSNGVEREIDFLKAPKGLNASTVSHNARVLDITLTTGPTMRMFVMHPVDVLHSRVANSSLPEKQTELARDQLTAAITLVPAYGRHLLDLGERPLQVEQMNKTVLAIAGRKRGRELYFNDGVDISQAVLEDPRLSDAHLTLELPKLREELEITRRNHQPAQQHPDLPATRPPADERSYYERFRDGSAPSNDLGH